MAIDPNERYPSAGDLGQAALVAAGALRRAGPESVVATGEAAPLVGAAARRSSTDGAPADSQAPAAVIAHVGGRDALRWAIALAGLVVVAVGMVAALHGISTL
jgi:hypothetical protein